VHSDRAVRARPAGRPARLAGLARRGGLLAVVSAATFCPLVGCSHTEAGDPGVPHNGAAASERVAEVARFLEDPATIASAHLEIEEQWFTDVVPPGGGTRRVTLDVAGTGRLERFSVVCVPDDSPKESRRELDRAAALELLLESLRELQAAGCLSLPAEVEPPKGLLAFAGSAYAVTLELHGDGRVAHFTTHLPATSESRKDVRPALEAVVLVQKRLSR